MPVGGTHVHRYRRSDSPSTVTGSFPRPRWFDVSMWGRPLDTCMLDILFREKFQGSNIVRRELGLPASYVPAADPWLQIDVVPGR